MILPASDATASACRGLGLLWQYGRMLLEQQQGKGVLGRTAEPHAVTDDAGHVLQYDQAQASKLAILYACALEVLHLARPESAAGPALDLACGPGLFTLALARDLGYSRTTGIDLSAQMIEAARLHAGQGRVDVDFEVGDVTRLGQRRGGEVGLCTFLQGAHHLSDLCAVAGVLRDMDRLVAPGGLVLVMDLVRLRTARLTERYLAVVGGDYRRRGLPLLFDDFRDSMYAAWTAEELRRALPRDSRRCWWQLVPLGLPLVQIVVGLPVGRRRLFLRRGLPWPAGQAPVPAHMVPEWKLLRWTLAAGRRRLIPPRFTEARSI
jgi:2-polyprenyl-3-methyl-5-hydroxy-6-metoxy-1,4-benzoquinol methylase